MKDSSAYISNINKALKNIKSEIIVDFIHLNSKDIIIITNKVLSMLNFQTIERYIKNVNNIESKQVKAPRLP